MSFNRERKLSKTCLLVLFISVVLITNSPVMMAKPQVHFSLYDDPEAVIIEHLKKAEKSIHTRGINQQNIFSRDDDQCL